MSARCAVLILCAGTILCSGLAGCAVGPNFHRPAAPSVASYRDGGDGAAAPGPIAGNWWHALGNAQVDALVERGLTGSPQIDAAKARLRSAEASLRAGYGAFFPQASASFDATREKYSLTRLGVSNNSNVFSVFTPSLSVSYLLDIFGANRRTVEALGATAVAERETLRGTQLTLAGNIATTAIARAAFHEEVEAWDAIVGADEVQLAAAHARTVAGTQPLSSEIVLSNQLETARIDRNAARVKARQADDTLAVLIGSPPAGAGLPSLTLADFSPAGSVPLRLPSELVRHRPDILVAEATAHAASAQVGVATAAMLPQITLSASTGSTTNNFERLFTSGTGVWSYAAGVAAPIFEGGTLINRRKAAKATFVATMADYRQTVLTAFGQVADALTANAEDGAADAAATKAFADADLAWHLAQTNAGAGLLSAADLEAARVTWQQARIAALSARSTHLQDIVALYVALGGGDLTEAAKE
ncbi:RND efflux system outer membrane lipoprotein [Novosphingobium nitrogenifigens DSM 19370]|uniref:RND efflux system outer membrane lipoprotein n=1 Tax=Novosphingobium nitrogenifigens DSM 19370 TaxID=983920 RepID=F1Z8M2_9SPHN|nr:efflux transporter outer membrane subunit [Novosphingobium nitrogenifigens]EGD59003.1 RND efflux system outer membrane lipoprotein [Novosphingobium nitrogenifigens DSM 19370]